MTEPELEAYADGGRYAFHLRDGRRVSGILLYERPDLPLSARTHWYVLGRPSPTSHGERTEIRPVDVLAIEPAR